MTEPGAGSDAAAIATTATRVEGGYVLDGTKTWVSGAPDADRYLVYATVAAGPWLTRDHELRRRAGRRGRRASDGRSASSGAAATRRPS